MTVPQLTEAQLRALRIAARQTTTTTAEHRVDRHPLSCDYVGELTALGLLRRYHTRRGLRVDLTPEGAHALDAYWRGEKVTRPYVRTEAT